MTNQRRQERSQPQANRPFRPVKDTVQAADFYAAVGGYDTIERWDVA